MTEIGGNVPISEVSVDAGNWMTALKVARRAVGESGGVPPGASCQVAPDGRVTIHDAVARKTYSLAPNVETDLAPATPRGPVVPSDRVPRPSSVPPPSAVMGRSSGRKKKKAPQRTIAYNANELGIAAMAAQAAAAEPEKKAPQRTIAYNANELGIAAMAVQAAAAEPTAPEPTAAEPAAAEPAAAEPAAAEPAAAEPAAAEPKKKKKKAPQRTIAYNVNDLGLGTGAPAQPAVEPVAEPEPAPAPAQKKRKKKKKKKKAPQRTIAYDARELGLAPPEPSQPEPSQTEPSQTEPSQTEPQQPEPQQPEPSQPEPSQPEPQQPASADPDASVFQLLMSRDAEPTAESPLTYRERVYYVPPGPSVHVLEALLMAQFETLREELADRPKGKLANLALFDHAWKGRPDRPPMMTLQWKDWRGEPVLTKSAEGSAPVAEAQPVPSPSQPAPALAAAPSAPPAATPQSTPAPAASQPPAAVAPAAAAPVQAKPAKAKPAKAKPAKAKPAKAKPAKAKPAQPKSDDRLATAFEALQDLFFLTTPIEGVDFVMQLLGDLIPSEAKSTCLYDINTDELRFVAMTGPGGDERRGEGVPRLAGLFGSAALSPNQAVLVEDVTRDERFDPGVDGRIGLMPETLAVVAVSHQGRLLGALQLINRQDQAQYSRADANLLFYVAEKLAEYLHAARLRPQRHG